MLGVCYSSFCADKPFHLLTASPTNNTARSPRFSPDGSCLVGVIILLSIKFTKARYTWLQKI